MVCILSGVFTALTSLLVFTELGILREAFNQPDYKKIFAEGTCVL
jgi:hypothetical protein